MKKLTKNADLLILWVLVTTTAIFVGFALMDWSLIYSRMGWPTMLAISLGVIGVLTGAGQWAVLRMRLKRVWMWIPATAIGVPIGFFVGLAVDTGIFAAGDTLNIAGLLGLVVGIPQWFVIRNKVKKAYWWIPVSILSWAVGAKIGFDILGQIILEHLSWADSIKLSGVITGVSFGALVGIIGGFSMAQLLESSIELEGDLQGGQ